MAQADTEEKTLDTMTTVGLAGARSNGSGIADAHDGLPHLIDATTLAAHLGVTVRTIRRKVTEREIPYIRIGNLIRFDPVEIAAWLDAARVTPHARRCAACQNGSRP